MRSARRKLQNFEKRNFSYDGRNMGDITVMWSNGKEETIPEIYLEKVKDE